MCIVFGGIIFAAASANLFGEVYTVKSPDGKIVASVSDGKTLEFSLKADGKVLLENCAIGMDTDKGYLGRNASALSSSLSSHSGQIETVYGIRKTVKDEYNQLELKFKDFKLLVRVYNEAAAYRFVTDFGGTLIVNDEILELSSIKPSDKVVAHAVKSKRTSFERLWLRDNAGLLKKKEFDSATLPFFFEKNGLKVAVLESAWFDYPGMRISWPEGSESMRAVFAREPKKLALTKTGHMYIVKEEENRIAKTDGSRSFPWRVFIVGRNDIDFADNDTVYKLAEPSKIADTSWIKVGPSVWDWWVNWNTEGVDFPLGFNDDMCRYYVDFAAANNIPFVTFDAGWHVGRSPEMKKYYNLTERFIDGKPAVDIPGIVKYANSKGVKVIIWVYSKVLYDQPERALDLFKSWGVYGLKIDFSDRDDQWLIRHFENISKLAADRKMVIDWHGCPAPAGFQRTYPNSVNFEGVYGGEVNKWSPAISPSHNVDLVFTRMLSGPMDYTPGGMRNCAVGNWTKSNDFPNVNGTRAHMIAQYILFYGPLQMISDMPSEYLKQPDILKFIAETPTSWDDTKAIEGKMGEYVVVARRKGDVWYVGGMCDWGGKTVELDLSKFLPEGDYCAELFCDAPNSNKIATDFRRVVKNVKSSDKLKIEMKKGGGFALKLVPDSFWPW